MNVIAFMSQKGGSGKTTLAVHTAVAACEAGQKCVVIDTDPQESATTWASARTQPEPMVATAHSGQLENVLKAARSDGMTLAIIDCAPHAAPAASQIVRRTDLVLIPCRPSAFDLSAVGTMFDIVKAASARAAFVLSACPFRAPEIGETREALLAYGLPVAPVEIGDRRSYSRAVASGRAVTEFEADGKAAHEIRALWQWIGTQIR
ncbi:MAG: ParA family partition ATPase [Roseiarcus sp.]